MKVNQKSDGNVEQSQVREQLGFIHRMECFLTLELRYYPAFDYQIGAEPAFEFHSLVNQRNRLLPFHSQAQLFKFIR